MDKDKDLYSRVNLKCDLCFLRLCQAGWQNWGAGDIVIVHWSHILLHTSGLLKVSLKDF